MYKIFGIRKALIDNYNGFYQESSGSWKSLAINTILSQPENHLKKIPPEERHNIFFTSYETGLKVSDWQCQNIIPIDIDKMEREDAEDVFSTACKILGLDPNLTGCTWTGHGLHILIQTDFTWDYVEYFETHRAAYAALCRKVNEAIDGKGVCDPDVWRKGFYSRLPGSINRKPDMPDTIVETIQPHISAQPFGLVNATGISPYNHDNIVALQRSIDTDSILRGCAFIKYTKENPTMVTEAQWFLLLSLLTKMPDGGKLCHDYSSLDAGRYNPEETDTKIQQAVSYAPPSCKGVNKYFTGCATCPHYNKVKTPLSIKGENFIETQNTGFRSVIITRDGVTKPGPVDVDGYTQYYTHKNKLICVADVCYIYNDTHYTRLEDRIIARDIEQEVSEARNRDVIEILHKIKRAVTEHDTQFFIDSIEGYINLRNGVYCTRTKRLLPHSPNFGFLGVQDYDYDVDAQCPTFSQFLEEIMLGDPILKENVLEYFASALFSHPNDPAVLQYWIGDGRNGKSTLIKVFQSMITNEEYSAVPVRWMDNPTYLATAVYMKLNISEETSAHDLTRSTTIKQVTSGDDVICRELYGKPQKVKPRFKLICTSNHNPTISDTSEGFMRRVHIVPFRYTIPLNKVKGHTFLTDLCAERSGILNLIIQSYADYKQRGYLRRSNTTIEATAMARQESHPLTPWAESCLTFTGVEQDYLGYNELYRSYVTWSENLGDRRPISITQFYKQFPSLQYPIHGPDGSVTYGLTGLFRTTSARFRTGIKFTTQSNDY